MRNMLSGTKWLPYQGSTKIEYKYDFDDGTWTNAKLLSEWWVDWDTWLNATSDGLVFANTATDKSWWREKTVTINPGVKKITLYYKWIKSDSRWWTYGVIRWSVDWTNKNIVKIDSRYYNPKTNCAEINSVRVASNTYHSAIEWTIEYNVITWAYSIDIDWTTYSWTVSTFNIPNELYIRVWLWKWYYSTPSYVYKCYVTFEF